MLSEQRLAELDAKVARYEERGCRAIKGTTFSKEYMLFSDFFIPLPSSLNDDEVRQGIFSCFVSDKK